MTKPAVATIPDHPAKWSEPVLIAIAEVVAAEARRQGGRSDLRVLDPFAGIGRLRLAEAVAPHAQVVRGIELQPEWSGVHTHDAGTWQGDAAHLESAWTGIFDAVITSPTFGNRMSDHHEAKDPCKACGGFVVGVDPAGSDTADASIVVLPRSALNGGKPCKVCGGTGLSKRYTYAHYLAAAGATLVDGSAAAMAWGRSYRLFHRDALREMIRVLVPGGLLVINMSNHFRTLVKGKPSVEQDVVGWWVNQIIVAGCRLRAVLPVETRRNKNGANRELRAEAEVLIVAHTPDPRRPQ